jgi:hypothetical protein
MTNEVEKTFCTWTPAEEGYPEEYESGCGERHWFNNGGPEENNFEYCPFCGKELK